MRSPILLRKIGGVFAACRRNGIPMLGEMSAAGGSPIASTAAFLTGQLIVPLLILIAIAALLAWHPAGSLAIVGAGKLGALGGVLGEIETADNALVEKREQFGVKQREIGEIFALAKDGPSRYDFSRKSVMDKLGAVDAADAFAKIQQRNAELDALGSELQNLETKRLHREFERRQDMLTAPAGGVPHPTGREGEKSIGELFIESKAYTDGFRKNGVIQLPVMLDVGMKSLFGLKTLFQTTQGLAPESVRTGLMVDAATRPIEMLDFIPTRPINQAVDKYMEETVFTPGAGETAEGASYGEAHYEWTERTSPVQKIADSVPVTDEQLEDAPQVAGIIDQRLRFGLRQRLDGQSLNGDGTGSNLTGIYNKGGIQSQAKGVDSALDAFFKAMTLVRFTGRANPNLGVFHPTDWQGIRLLKDSQGRYIMGDPSQAGPSVLFGTPIAMATSGSAGTALVGDFLNFIYISERRGIEVQIGYVNTQFTDGKKTLRADMRAALTITRAQAFCKITGL